MEAQYVATVQYNGPRHGIRDGWTYSRITEARTVCGVKGPFTIEHLHSGRDLPVSCGNCTRMSNSRKKGDQS